MPQVSLSRKLEWTDFLEYQVLHAELLYTSNLFN